MALTRMAAGLQSRSMLMNTVDGSTRASSFWERGIKTEFLPMMGETLCLLARSKSGG